MDLPDGERGFPSWCSLLGEVPIRSAEVQVSISLVRGCVLGVGSLRLVERIRCRMCSARLIDLQASSFSSNLTLQPIRSSYAQRVCRRLSAVYGVRRGAELAQKKSSGHEAVLTSFKSCQQRPAGQRCRGLVVPCRLKARGYVPLLMSGTLNSLTIPQGARAWNSLS